MKNNLNVIFVDDEASHHTLIKLKFRKEIKDGSLKTFHFMDGEECLNFLRTKDDELEVKFIITDITMPKMDGITLAKIIHQDYPQIRLFMASALDISEYRERVKDEYSEGFFGKPIKLNEIKSLLFQT